MDYKIYELSKKEWLLYGGQGGLYLAVLSFVFYRSIFVFLLLLPLGVCYPIFMKKDLKKKRMEQLNLQFKDAILSVAASLRAGYSVENAFAVSLDEVSRIHGEDSMISKEIRLLLQKNRMNLTFEEALENFAARSGLEDVKSFSDVFLAARRNGGGLMKIIARTAEIIGEKIRVQEDIITATASRRMEQKVMSAVPVLIVFYMELTSPGFFDILYTTVAGRIIMTACLLVYLGALYMAKTFMEISV